MKLGDFIETLPNLITEKVIKFGDGVIIEYLREEGSRNAKIKFVYVPFIGGDEELPLYNRQVDETKKRYITNLSGEFI